MIRKLIGYGLFAVVFLAAGAWFGKFRQNAPDPVTTTVPAGVVGPTAVMLALSLPTAQGQQEALSKWQGKNLIVNFWAPWCAPCVEEMPELSELHAADGGKTFHVIGIGIDSPGNIADFSSRVKVAYPLYVAGLSGTDLSRQFGNTQGGLPFTVLVGADGQVRKTYLGRLKFDQLKADLAVFKE